MAMNFAQIANKKLDDIERPPLPPVGTYQLRVGKLPEERKSPDEKWTFLSFQMQVVAPTDDVDTDDYKGDLRKQTFKLDFIFDSEDQAAMDKTMFQLKRFLLDHLQISGADTIAEAINSSVGASCLGTVVHKQDKNDSEIYHANIGRTAPLD